jgi:hypothetical protein
MSPAVAERLSTPMAPANFGIQKSDIGSCHNLTSGAMTEWPKVLPC